MSRDAHWDAVTIDGRTLTEGEWSYAELRAESVARLTAPLGGRLVAIEIPPGGTPFFLRRVRASTYAGSFVYAVCAGYERADGSLDLTWLRHDGLRLRTDSADPPEMNV